MIQWLESKGINAVFHYQSLHRSAFYAAQHDGRNLLNSDRFSDALLRLPLYHELSSDDLSKIFREVCSFYKNGRT